MQNSVWSTKISIPETLQCPFAWQLSQSKLRHATLAASKLSCHATGFWALINNAVSGVNTQVCSSSQEAYRGLASRCALEPDPTRPEGDLQGVYQAGQLVLLPQGLQLAQNVLVDCPSCHQRQHLPRHTIHLKRHMTQTSAGVSLARRTES